MLVGKDCIHYKKKFCTWILQWILYRALNVGPAA